MPENYLNKHYKIAGEAHFDDFWYWKSLILMSVSKNSQIELSYTTKSLFQFVDPHAPSFSVFSTQI